ncbi:MAG: hypothetical protein V1646_01250 [bacterium]
MKEQKKKYKALEANEAKAIEREAGKKEGAPEKKRQRKEESEEEDDEEEQK